MRSSFLVACAALVVVCGCSQRPKVECGSPAADSVTTDLIRKEIEKSAAESLKSGSSSSQSFSSNIRATISQLTLSLLDVRTTKEDPNSTKRFCTATVKIIVPPDTLKSAEDARSAAGISNIDQLADNNKVERSADAFTVSLDYDIQPTDNGEKIYSESGDLGSVTGFFGELVASSLLKSAIDQAQAEQQKATEAARQKEEADAAGKRVNDQSQAKQENQLAIQTINAVWQSLPAYTRSDLLDQEREWLAKKNSDCKIESASSSTDATEQETARLRCDTRENQARTEVLKQAANGSG